MTGTRGFLERATRVAVVAAVVLLPLKYFSILAGSASNVSAFRLAAALLIALVAARLALDPAFRGSALARLRTRTTLALLVFGGWVVVGCAVGFLTAPTELLERRSVAAAVAQLLGVVGFALAAIVALPTPEALRRTLRLACAVWWALILFAFVQVALHALDLPVNGFTVQEGAVGPESGYFGLDLLRPYSLFGEPRDLAAFVFPVVFLRAYLGARPVTAVDCVVVGVLGVLLASFTFYLALALVVVYLLVFEWRAWRSVVPVAAAATLLALVLGLPALAAVVPTGDGPRVITILDDLADEEEGEPKPPVGGEPPRREGTASFNQAPDLLSLPYARDLLLGRHDIAQVVVGTGLGSFTSTINPYYVRKYDHDLVANDELVNSRLLPFATLVELGVVGVALLAWAVLQPYWPLRRLSLPRIAVVRTAVAALVIASLVQVSTVYALGIVLAELLRVGGAGSRDPDVAGPAQATQGRRGTVE